VPDIDRATFLRVGAAGAVAAATGALAGPAAAALPVPRPQGDDVGFLSFGAVAELTSRAWYQQALHVQGFSRRERRRLEIGHAAKRDHVIRLNAVLGADAIAPDDFAARLPGGSFADPHRAVALGVSLEELLVGAYLNGAAFARDAATRLLLGRLLVFDAQQLAWMRGLDGATPAGGLAVPLSLEQAGARLDRLLTTPSFPS
jgi:ferritin-like protein